MKQPTTEQELIFGTGEYQYLGIIEGPKSTESKYGAKYWQTILKQQQAVTGQLTKAPRRKQAKT